MMTRIANIWVGDHQGPVAGPVSGWIRAGIRGAGEKVNPFRMVFGNSRDVQVQASPITHVRAGLPPFLVLGAEHEVPGLKEMAEEFAKAMRRAGNTVEEREVPGCTHQVILFNLDKPNDPTGQALLSFLDRYARRTE